MANKKINQLVSKTSILSTDLFGIGDATTGQLFKKTIAELQAAIGGAVISVNGLVGTVVLDTDDIQELATPTNKYFTDARARAAISLTVTGNSGASTYSSGTGVLNVPTYTLAGLGGITASFLSGTSGISYNSTTGVISYSGTVYTDSSIRALLSGGTGISYNSTTGAISYSGTVYTDASVRALISLTTTGTSGASTFNNTTGVINVPEYTLAGLGGISLTSLSGGTGITYNSSTGAISYSGTVYTDASVRALISASGAVSYNNTTGVISLTSGNLTEATSSVLTITGGTGAVLGSGTSIQVKQATTSVSGFLSSTDWNTFNSKANALSGTTNYHAKFTSSTAIGNSLIYDDGTKIGIGTASPVGASSDDLVTQIYNSAGSGSASRAMIRLTNSFSGSTWGNGSWMSIDNILDLFIANSEAANMYFQTNATTRMTITSAGNVGIGVTPSGFASRTVTLQVGANTTGISSELVLGHQGDGFSMYTAGGSGAGQLAFRSSTTDAILTFGLTGAATFSSSVTAGARFASIVAGFELSMSGTSGFDNSSYIQAYNTNTSTFRNLSFYGKDIIFLSQTSTDAERMRIVPSGNILMGTTSDNGERLYVSGNIRATGTITANSDLTLKKNLLKIENALEKVEQINGYTYEFKEDDSKRHAGVIAQEIQTVLPEIVNKGNDGILGVEYGNISALLIEAIKEQNIKIKNLETLLASK